jgi:hypothetical protein
LSSKRQQMTSKFLYSYKISTIFLFPCSVRGSPELVHEYSSPELTGSARIQHGDPAVYIAAPRLPAQSVTNHVPGHETGIQPRVEYLHHRQKRGYHWYPLCHANCCLLHPLACEAGPGRTEEASLSRTVSSASQRNRHLMPGQGRQLLLHRPARQNQDAGLHTQDGHRPVSVHQWLDHRTHDR